MYFLKHQDEKDSVPLSIVQMKTFWLGEVKNFSEKEIDA